MDYLPRIVSTESGIAVIIDAVPFHGNGLRFCTGPLGARSGNDLLQKLKRFPDHIHILHLRDTAGDDCGNFYEATHPGSDTDIFAIVSEVLQIKQQRGVSLPMRPVTGIRCPTISTRKYIAVTLPLADGKRLLNCGDSNLAFTGLCWIDGKMSNK